MVGGSGKGDGGGNSHSLKDLGSFSAFHLLLFALPNCFIAAGMLSFSRWSGVWGASGLAVYPVPKQIPSCALVRGLLIML